MRDVSLGESAKLSVILEGFNLFNRFNEAAALPFFTDVNATNKRDAHGHYRSQPTAAHNPCQFQFGLKLRF